MYILDSMSFGEKVRLLFKIFLLNKGVLKYQTVEIYDWKEKDLDIKTKVVLFCQPNHVFYIRTAGNKFTRSTAKSYKDWMGENERKKARRTPYRSMSEELGGSPTITTLLESDGTSIPTEITTYSGTYNPALPDYSVEIIEEPPSKKSHPVEWSESMSKIVLAQRKYEEERRIRLQDTL